MYKAFIVYFVVCFATALAQQCPKSSRGQYPACECLNGAQYDVTYNWCVSSKSSANYTISIEWNLCKYFFKVWKCIKWTKRRMPIEWSRSLSKLYLPWWKIIRSRIKQLHFCKPKCLSERSYRYSYIWYLFISFTTNCRGHFE